MNDWSFLCFTEYLLFSKTQRTSITHCSIHFGYPCLKVKTYLENGSYHVLSDNHVIYELTQFSPYSLSVFQSENQILPILHISLRSKFWKDFETSWITYSWINTWKSNLVTCKGRKKTQTWDSFQRFGVAKRVFHCWYCPGLSGRQWAAPPCAPRCRRSLKFDCAGQLCYHSP